MSSSFNFLLLVERHILPFYDPTITNFDVSINVDVPIICDVIKRVTFQYHLWVSMLYWCDVITHCTGDYSTLLLSSGSPKWDVITTLTPLFTPDQGSFLLMWRYIFTYSHNKSTLSSNFEVQTNCDVNISESSFKI
jgi:hypothetical protein